MDQNPGITNIRRNGKAENVPDGLVLTVFLFLPFPYLADREGRSGFCKKVFQCIFKEFHGTFAGGLWIFMFDLIANTIWRRVSLSNPSSVSSEEKPESAFNGVRIS